jgi:heme A synthase
VVIAIHLLNTLGLMASYTLLSVWSADDRPLARPDGLPLLVIAVLVVLLTSATGAVTALGDTLFPVRSALPVAQRVGADLAPAMHFLVRLRIVHPLIAATSALYLLFVGGWFSDRAQRPAIALMVLVVAQVSAGLLNIALAAPNAMQLVHLFLANAVWIALVVLGVQGAMNTSRIARPA